MNGHVQLDLKEIRLKCLTKNHTHMADNGLHGDIEKKNSTVRHIYNFESFCMVIKESRSKPVEVILVQTEDFRMWKSENYG